MAKQSKRREMTYTVYYRPGLRKDKKSYLAISPDLIGGFAFGKTEETAVRALKRLYSRKLKKAGD